MKRFDGTLTAEHLEIVEMVRDRWMANALSTEPCDQVIAKKMVGDVYRSVGKEVPPVIFMSSPLGGLFAYAVLKNQLRGQLGGQLGDQLRGQLGDQLRDQLGDQLGDQLRGQLRGQLWGQLGGQLWGQLGGQLWGQLWGQLGGQLWGQLGGQLWGQLGGQLRDQLGYEVSPWRDAYWLALYACALPFAGLQISDRLNALVAATEQSGWWWPYEGLAIVTDRPSVLLRDGQARLHCETGPALAYRDGYAMHSWHGVRVPEWVTGADGGPTLERVLGEPNTEVRRCAIEAFGWDRMIESADLRLVDEQPDPGNTPHKVSLYDVPVDLYDSPIRVLLCTNGSPDRSGRLRQYGLTVPADMPDALTASAWTYGLDRETYAGCERRT